MYVFGCVQREGGGWRRWEWSEVSEVMGEVRARYMYKNKQSGGCGCYARVHLPSSLLSKKTNFSSLLSTRSLSEFVL